MLHLEASDPLLLSARDSVRQRERPIGSRGVAAAAVVLRYRPLPSGTYERLRKTHRRDDWRGSVRSVGNPWAPPTAFGSFVFCLFAWPDNPSDDCSQKDPGDTYDDGESGKPSPSSGTLST